MTNTDTQYLPTAFARTEPGSWRLFLLLTPDEFKILFDAVFPYMIGPHRFMRLEWALTEDADFGRVGLDGFGDWDETLLRVALEAYHRINS